MDRVRGVHNPNLLARLLFWAFRKKMGLVPKSKTVAAHHTPTLLAGSWMDDVNASARTVPPNLKELAQLKVAAMVGCPF